MNTRNNTAMVSALVAILIVSTAPFALAQGPGHGQGRGQGHGDGGPRMPIERMAKHLNLSVEQVNSIQEIRESGRAGLGAANGWMEETWLIKMISLVMIKCIRSSPFFPEHVITQATYKQLLVTIP